MTTEESIEKILGMLSTVAELQLKHETEMLKHEAEMAQILRIEKATASAMRANAVVLARTLDAVSCLTGVLQKHEAWRLGGTGGKSS